MLCYAGDIIDFFNDSYDIKWKWRDTQPSMVTYIQNPCSAFTHPSAHTHQWTHTPRAVGSHLCCGARGAVGGSVPCSRAPHRCIEGGESAGYSLPSPTIPARLRLKLATFRLWVWLFTIRPWLPPLVDCRMTLTNKNGSLMGHHSILLGLPYYYSIWKCFHLAILCLI